MSQYFPGLYERSGGNLKIELVLSPYTTKVELKGAPGINQFTLESETGLVRLKFYMNFELAILCLLLYSY